MDRVKKLIVLVSLAVLPLGLSSCFWGNSAAKNNAARVAYLKESKTESARINVEGVYFSNQWGLVALKQTAGGRVQGVMGGYGTLHGVVSGKTLAMYLDDDGWTDYTFKLTQTRADQLKGWFSAHVPFTEKGQQEIILEKIRR